MTGQHSFPPAQAGVWSFIYMFEGIKGGREVRSERGENERIFAPEGNTWKRVIVVSNRLPFKVSHSATGERTITASSGGLITAMSPLLREGVAGKWVGWPGTEEEEGLEEAFRRSTPNGPFDIGVVHLSAADEEGYYRGYSNNVLCPLFEGHLEVVDFKDAEAYWETYQGVQEKFAQKITEDLQSKDIVWVHDYHLAGVGQELRKKKVEQPLGYFLHMPFPSREHFALLPQREAFLRSLLSYDIIGFQTALFKNNFLEAVESFVPEAAIERSEGTISRIMLGGRVTRVGNFPISIDPREFLGQLRAPETAKNVARLQKALSAEGAHLIFNAGRLDYTKGFYEELLAFDRLLTKHPELVGKVILYQLVIPSRESIPAYREYKEKIIELARSINQKYKTVLGGPGNGEERYPGMPIRQIHGHMGRPRYLAHVRAADIQSIPTKADGMNLVAKEGAIVGKGNAVQILGKAAGAAEELGEHALLISPEDTESFADALYEAYTMGEFEKRQRKARMSQIVSANDVFSWWSKEQEPMFQEVWNEKRIRGKTVRSQETEPLFLPRAA